MKRRALLYVTDCEAKRFESYLFRKQLPFVPAPLPFEVEDDPVQRQRRADYSVGDAFALRLMLDFTDQGGLDVSAGRYAGANAWRKLIRVSEGAGDIYLVHVAEERAAGQDFDPQQLFACRLPQLEAALAESTDPDTVRRVTLVNASRASRFVLARAAEFDVFPDHYARPAWSMQDVY